MTIDQATRDAAAKGFLELCEHLWAAKYAPGLEAQVREEQELRSDPFAEGATYSVFGEELRMMTPRDLVHLDGYDIPFVTGGEADQAHAVFFLWTLSAENRGGSIMNAWRRGRFNARVGLKLATEGFNQCDMEIGLYMRRVLFDLPEPDKTIDHSQEPPPPINCIAGLLVDVAGLVGPNDPFSGKLLADTPIPRLVQYRRTAQPAKKITGRLERARVYCQEEANVVMKAIRERK